MKYLSILLLAIVSFVFLPACKKTVGEGESIREDRLEKNFVKVRSEIGSEIFIRQANEFKISIEGQQNILDVLETVVENYTLIIRFKSNSRIASHVPIKVYINMPQISGLELNGSGDIMLFNEFNTNEFEVDIKGAGDVKIEHIIAETMRAKISGSGDITISAGHGDFEKMTINGSGSMDFSSFEVREAQVSIFGAGSVKVSATDKLKVNISGSGDVYYKGNPVIEQNISGSGNIKQL